MVLIVAFVLVFLFAFQVHSGPFTSSSLPGSFDPNHNPLFFIQLTDLHYAPAVPERTAHNDAIMRKIANLYKPPVLTLTGDITDGTEGSSMLSYHQPYISNWNLYNNSRFSTGITNDDRIILEAAGNHDLFGIRSVNSSKNYYDDFVLHRHGDFYARSAKVTTDAGVVQFVIFNPTDFPFLTAPYGFSPFVYKDVKDKLLAAIDPTAAKHVLLVHFPTSVMWGNDIAHIGKHFDLILTGHTHPSTYSSLHNGKGIEVVMAPTRNSDVVGLYTIDNGQIVVDGLDTTVENPYFVTYPVPKNQLTPGTCFNLNSFPVRAISFGATPISLPVTLDGTSLGNLVHLRTVNGTVQFYSLDVTTTPGSHTLKVGDKTIEFMVGEKSPSYVEGGMSTMFFNSFVVLAIFFFAYDLLRLIPWWMLTEEVLDAWHAWAYDDHGEFTIWQSLYLGPYHQLTRLRNAPLVIRIACWVLQFWFVIIPFYTCTTEDDTSYQYVWGAVTGRTVRSDGMPIMFLALYMLLIVTPLLSIVSLWYENEKWKVLHWVGFVISWFWVLLALVIWCVVAILMGGVGRIFTGPVTYFVVAFIALIIVAFAKPEIFEKQVISARLDP